MVAYSLVILHNNTLFNIILFYLGLEYINQKLYLNKNIKVFTFGLYQWGKNHSVFISVCIIYWNFGYRRAIGMYRFNINQVGGETLVNN